MKVIKENQFIKCKKCGKILGEYKDGWLKLEARKINYSSNGIIHKFVCSKCKKITDINILK